MPEINVRIGLEIHVPLKTEEKLFCHCPANYYETEEPNVNVCPVCTGMPGAKPFPINSKALMAAILIAKLLNCKIPNKMIFVKRKHYDYPDLPSGYQRTSEPIGINGELSGVRIWEVHLEEDPGRYDLLTGKVDYNRSGAPLVEIVTAPDMKSAEEVREFLKELLNLLRYSEVILDIGGVLRADVNISLEGGSRVEIKNINSIKGAYKAINYEIMRQKNLMKRGIEVRRETRGYNEKSMITFSLRTKETEEDYRYIPDPDIPPLILTSELVDVPLPETPQLRRERIVKEYGIPEKYAKILVKDKHLADLFEIVAKNIDPNLAASWICREVLRQLNYRSIELRESKLNAEILEDLLSLLTAKKITENTAKKLLERVIDTGELPSKIVEEENLERVADENLLEAVINEVVAKNEKAVLDYKSGKKEALNFLLGQVMKEMRGKADPKVAIKLLLEKIEKY